MEGKESFGMDIKTPINVTLSAFYKRSFAFHTIKDRIPIILTETIDSLIRNKNDILKFYGLDGIEELKLIIGEISKLKYEIQTNKPILKIEGTTDAALYNQFLEEQMIKIQEPTPFNAQWLHLECYVYRRLMAAIQKTKIIPDLDPFIWKKEESFAKSLELHIQLGNMVDKVLNDTECDLQKEFTKLLKLNLWGNKCDLSITYGVVREEDSHVDNLEKLNTKLLSDASEDIWNAISTSTEEDSSIVDIVLDNTGYEFFCDLCLADFLVEKKFAETIRFYVKSFPWFISDVTRPDIDCMLRQLQSNKNATLRKLADRWLNYIQAGVWTLESSDFWTLPYTYKEMRRIDPDLYRKLSEAKLVIFKGDLNYRKLLGEKNWLYTTPFPDALDGFYPTKLCALRTLKADLVCGLNPGVAEEAEETDKNWLIDGKFGVIQFSNLIEKI
ncbi:damage-control phosphatase ARMT1-like [Onthophagus taurus]|uniref:damage-control phosphatase ARMT1-like n=1 Tax=Onthophagus taurus TaxID=166361 RepID=UPI000C20667C|nr:protein-glutamate O-methyltransferase-like [Onthophagus taurus]